MHKWNESDERLKETANYWDKIFDLICCQSGLVLPVEDEKDYCRRLLRKKGEDEESRD